MLTSAVVTIDIEGDPSLVWDLVRTPAKAILTAPGLVMAERIDGSPIGLGERVLHVMDVEGRRYTFEATIVEYVEGRRLAARIGPTLQTFDFEYWERGTQVTLRIDLEVPLRSLGLGRPGASAETMSLEYLAQLRRVAESGVVDGLQRARPEALAQTPPRVVESTGRTAEWWRFTVLRLLVMVVVISAVVSGCMYGFELLQGPDHAIGASQVEAIVVIGLTVGVLFAPLAVHSGSYSAKPKTSFRLDRTSG